MKIVTYYLGRIQNVNTTHQQIINISFNTNKFQTLLHASLQFTICSIYCIISEWDRYSDNLVTRWWWRCFWWKLSLIISVSQRTMKLYNKKTILIVSNTYIERNERTVNTDGTMYTYSLFIQFIIQPSKLKKWVATR